MPICVHTWWLHPRPLLLAGGYITELPFVTLSCYFKRWFPLQKDRQWAYVGGTKKVFFRLEMGTDGNDFYIQKINCYNECELQFCIILSKRILDRVSGGTWGTTSCLQKGFTRASYCLDWSTENTKTQPGTSKGYPDTVIPPWSQPWEERMQIFYKSRTEQRVF